MQWLTDIRRRFITTRGVKWIIRKSKHICPPGFMGISVFDVFKFFFVQMKKTGMNERASSIAFSLLLAIPPAVIFLFTLVPYIPISEQFIDELFILIRDVIPSGRNNSAIITFLEDFIKNPRNDLLSFGFLLALFYSSNAVMGIMRSFDRNYAGFTKRNQIDARLASLRITVVLFFVVIISVLLLIMQGAVLAWLGVTNVFLRELLHNLRWLVIVLLFFASISLIYRYVPSVHKKWNHLNAGAILATALMLLFTALFSYWVNNFSNFNKLYGSIGTVLILMLLIYFNSLVLLIGFELNVSINALKREVEERRAIELKKQLVMHPKAQ